MNISENSAKNIDAIAKDGKDNLKEIKDMALNTKAMVNLTKNLQALQQALFENSKSATILSIDGKKVATATNRYAEYHKAVQ